MTTAVILQPCFFPWRGQFDLISRADVTVFLDNVQYVRRSWYNRNRIMTRTKPEWLTVPVKSKGRYRTQICDIRIDDSTNWKTKILAKLTHAYRSCPHFDDTFAAVEDIILRDWTHISDLSRASVEWAMNRLDRSCNFLLASELGVDSENPVERLVGICGEIGADRYLTGPAAKNYIVEEKHFRDGNIELEWMEYPEYPLYPQVHKCADTPLSILDLFFNVGEAAPAYIWR